MPKILKSYGMITIGCALAGFAVACFLIPCSLAAGGLSGIATVINHLTGLPVGTVVLVLNVPLLWIGIRSEGGSFGVRTCYASIVYSLFIDVFSMIPPLTGDKILASVYGGAALGLGLGMVFRTGATTGGIDIVAKLAVNKFRSLTTGSAIMACDVIIILAASAVFRSLYTGLYSIIALYLSVAVIDNILEGVDFAKTVIIITDKHDEVAGMIMDRLGRGVTGLNGRGMYTGSEKLVLLCTVRKNQIFELRRIVTEADQGAFVITSDSREVIGEGFSHGDD